MSGTSPQPPLVSIVIAARNVAPYLAETISSALGQGAVDGRLELVVVVDGGDEATLAVARSFAADPRVSVLGLAGEGVSAARNAGLHRCRAPYVLFLDGDDVFEAGALAAFVRVLDANPAAVGAIGAHVKIDQAGRLLPDEATRSARPPFPPGDGLRRLLERNAIVNGGTVCLRAGVVRRAGGYDRSLRLGEDWELWCRLACEGPFASLGDQVVLRYRQRRASAMAASRGQALTPSAAAVEKIFALPVVRARFGEGELARLRRRALIDMHWAAARAALHRGQRKRFAGYAVLGLLRYPDSLLRGYLLRFLGRWIASSFRRGPLGQRGAG